MSGNPLVSSVAPRESENARATYQSRKTQVKACHVPIPTFEKNEKKRNKKQKNLLFLRIEKRGLNLMRSMQQGISTHYNTRFGI